MTETTTTARKSEATCDAMTDCAGLMTARLAGQGILRTEFILVTLTTNNQQSKTTKYDNTKTN